MARTYRVQHCFQMQGGTSLDTACNQFYFYSAAHEPADVESWGGLLANYVHQLFVSTTGGVSISRFYNNRCAGNLGTTKIYDAGVSGPGDTGAPIFTIADEVLVPSAEYLFDIVDTEPGLPEEVALCLSYQAVHTEGNLPRRRGRIYFGPFNQLAVEEADVHAPVRPAGVLMAAMNGAAVQVQAAAAGNDFEWRIFSPSDGFAFKIVNFSVDNAFDTIRGRGQAPSERITVPIT